MSDVCLGITLKNKKCTKKTKHGYCRHHISQKKDILLGKTTQIIDITSEEIEECCVCTDPIEKKLECGHYIHMDCVIRSGKDLCPVCRTKLNLNISDRKKMHEYAEKYRKSSLEEEHARIRKQYYGSHFNRNDMLENMRILFEGFRNPRIRLPLHNTEYMIIVID